MRTVIWVVLIFTVAVVAATTLGSNDGLVSVFFGGWRTDLSLNLFVLLLLGAWFALTALVRGIEALLSLPRRAGQWRALRRERALQRSLREAQFEFAAGRYARALKAAEAAQRAVEPQQDVQQQAAFGQGRLAALVLAAQSLHRMQDRAGRDRALGHALQEAERQGERSATEAARLMAAEHALDDGEPERALQLLGELAPGVARRTHALRMRLRAARLASRPAEALRTARLLVNHQALPQGASEGLLRALACQVLDLAVDAEQLRQAWVSLESADRKDVAVCVHAARRAAALGAAADALNWLEPAWAAIGWDAVETGADAQSRHEVVLALCEAVSAMNSAWLARVERALELRAAEPGLNLLAGLLFAQRELWGKARRPLERAARSQALAGIWRRRAWRVLAQAAQGEGDEARARQCERAAAEID